MPTATKIQDIKDYFSQGATIHGESYPEVTNKEILDFKRTDPEGFEEVKLLMMQQQ